MITKRKAKVLPPDHKGPPGWFLAWVDQNRKEMEARFNNLRQEFNQKIDEVKQEVADVKQEVADVRQEVDKVNARLNNLVKKNNLKE